jgi:hypothetical protein
VFARQTIKCFAYKGCLLAPGLANVLQAKSIVVGAQGAVIGAVGRSARLLLEKQLDRRVHLILKVIVDA